MRQIKRSVARNFMIFLVDENAPTEGLPGVALTLTVSKNGGAFASPNGSTTYTDRGGGSYSINSAAADLDTDGDVMYCVTAPGAITRYVVVGEVTLNGGEPPSTVTLADASLTAAKFGAGAIDAAAIADNAIDAGAIAAGALTAAKFAANAITSTVLADDAITAAKIATGAIDADAIADNAIDAGAIASDAITAAKIAAAAFTAAKFGAAAITSTVLADDAITAAKLAGDVTTELQSGLATAAALATVQSDTDNIQSRLPAALVSGRMDASVGAVAADAITAAAIADNAIDGGSVAASAVTKIQAGLALSADLSTISGQIDTLEAVAVGRWKVDTVANQLILYELDGTTPLATFDLLDDDEVASTTRIFERVPA